MKTYVSNIFNPFCNLSIEDYFFNNSINTKILFLWRNKSSIIIGRNQNPWQECNLDLMNKDKINLARRYSGGGSVYHDLGNINYSFISPSNVHNTDTNFSIIFFLLKKLNINCYLSEKKDILTKINNNVYKISGNAFRINKNNTLHHGTLLIKTDIKKLYKYLNICDKINQIDYRNIKSNKSKVINLYSLNKNIDINQITNLLLTINKLKFIQYIDNNNINFYLKKNDKYKELKHWDFIFGKTAIFFRKINLYKIKIKLTIEYGILTDLQIFSTSQKYENIKNWIKNSKPKYTKNSFIIQLKNNFSKEEKLLMKILYINIPETLLRTII